MAVFTVKQNEIIKDNLQSYLANFEPIRIERADYGDGFYVYQEGETNYVQYCYNIHYLNGWLYGAVQAKCKQLRQKE